MTSLSQPEHAKARAHILSFHMTPSPSPTGPVLITGGAGFIGSNLVDRLRATGRSVAVIDDLSHGHAHNLTPDVPLHVGDIRDAAYVQRVVEDVQPVTIFHLAAQADVRRAVAEPAFDAEVNIIGTLNVLEAARRARARCVFASTGGAAYGEDSPRPTPETITPAPLSHYGMSKMAGEGYCHLYGRLYGLTTVILRLANVYGPRQDPHGEAGVVAIFCDALLDNGTPRVFGDGGQTRDYVYVGDVADAFCAAESAPAGTICNIGTGRETSVLELIDALGYTGDIEHAPARTGELRQSSLDPRRAATVLDWIPRVSLADGLQETLMAMRRQREEPHASRVSGAFMTAPTGGDA